MILCGMLDLCRIIFEIIVDLFRPRAALEAEMLVLRQQIIVLRRGRPSRVPFLVVDRMVLSWVCQLFPKAREARSPSFGLIPSFAGIALVSDVTGAGNRGLVRAMSYLTVSAHTDGGVHRARAALRCARGAEWPFQWVHPSLTRGACAPHCNIPCST
jgi:hypothetical protein